MLLSAPPVAPSHCLQTAEGSNKSGLMFAPSCCLSGVCGHLYAAPRFLGLQALAHPVDASGVQQHKVPIEVSSLTRNDLMFGLFLTSVHSTRGASGPLHRSQ